MSEEKEEKLDRRDPRFRKVQITVDAYLPWIVDEEGRGRGLVTFQSFVTDVKEADTNEPLGTIGGGLGAVTLRRMDDGPASWQIHHDDLWHAFIEALESQA